MNNSLKFFLPILAVAVASFSLKTIKYHTKIALPASASDRAWENSGLESISSPYSVAETSDRLESIIMEKGLTLFARIDHSANASNADLELPPTELLILGNPKVGTPLMQCSMTAAIDLPQKIMVYQDESDRTQVVYNQPAYLKNRHNIQDCDEILTKIDNVLTAITKAATEQ